PRARRACLLRRRLPLPGQVRIESDLRTRERLRDRTPPSRRLRDLAELLRSRPGYHRLGIEVNVRNPESAVLRLDSHFRARVDVLRRQPRLSEQQRERHGEAARE